MALSVEQEHTYKCFYCKVKLLLDIMIAFVLLD